MKGRTIRIGAWFWLLLALTAGGGMFAQNPFELTPRLPEEVLAEEEAPAVPSNPFDIAAPPNLEGAPVAVIDSTLLEEFPDAAERILSSEESRYRRFLFTIVIQLFLFLTILFTLFRSVSGRIYRAFLNDNMLSQLHREQGSIVSAPYFLFYLFFFFNLGFFLFLLCWHFDVELAGRHWKSFLLLTGGAAALLGAKHLLLKLLEAALPVKRELRLYSFTIIIFSIVIGILLIPFNLLIAYGPQSAVPGVIALALGMIGLVFAFRFIRGLFIASRILGYHLFHFLLYICTVEIAPALIVAKTVYEAVASS
jgi:hypothetical protein